MPETDLEQNKTPTAPAGSGSVLAGVVVTLVSVVFSFIIAEVGFRLATGVPVLEASNWRLAGARTQRIGDRAQLDDKLGWTLKSQYRSAGFNTIELGIRRNGQESELRKGSILAVGDSFTEGFDEVNDAGTWPAHLEEIMGAPVVNGGVAGYAADQIMLRSEQLLPLIQPKTLIIGFTEVDIYRAALSDAGGPKPYFKIEKDELVYHPPGQLETQHEESAIGRTARGVLGYSALADHLFSRLAPAFWYPMQAAGYKEVDNQPIEIICRLLTKAKKSTDEKDIRMLLFLQYAGELVLEEPDIVEDMKTVSECAKASGIQVVDQFQPLKAVTKGKADLVAEYYDVSNDEFGHMTSKGNRHAAQLLADALRGQEQQPANSLPDEENSLETVQN